MMNLLRSKFPVLRKKSLLFQQIVKNSTGVAAQTKPSTQQRFTSEFKLRPEDIDDYLLIGSEIFKNAFKESVKIAENETDFVKRTQLVINELVNKREVYGTMNFDFQIPEPKEK